MKNEKKISVNLTLLPSDRDSLVSRFEGDGVKISNVVGCVAGLLLGRPLSAKERVVEIALRQTMGMDVNSDGADVLRRLERLEKIVMAGGNIHASGGAIVTGGNVTGGIRQK